MIGLSALVLALFGIRYAGREQRRAGSTTRRWTLVRAWLPVRRGVARLLIDLYDPRPFAVLLVVLVVVCLLLGRRRLAVLAVRRAGG